MLEDNLVSHEELREIWDATAKAPGSEEGGIDVEGFLSFALAVDFET